MKKLLALDLKTVIIIILIVVVVFQYYNTGVHQTGELIVVDGTKYEMIMHKIDTIYETTIVSIPTYKPQYVEEYLENEVETDEVVDTVKIIKNYLKTFKTIDTLQLIHSFPNHFLDGSGIAPSETLGYGIVTDIISENTIQDRNIQWNFKIPTIYNTKIVKELPKNQLYTGLVLNFDMMNFINSIGTGVILKTKRDRIYQLNAGLSNSITGETVPFVGGGLYWKIKFRK